MKKIPWAAPDIGEEEINSVVNSLKSGHLGGNGPNVEKFEKAFGEKVGVKHCIAVNNGTMALLVSLFAMREYLGEDLKVAVPSFTFIASANTAEIVGKALITDCDKRTWNIDNNYIPDDVNLIMPVDVGGLSVDYDQLKTLGLPIIADSAESIGGKYKGKYIGSQADIHCFSLHKAKIITTGEGGMITTNNYELYELLKSWCNHGYDINKKPWQYKHIRISLNCRMTDIEAAIGLVQLRKLDYYVNQRRKRVSIYKEILGDRVEYQFEPDYAINPYFFFGILLSTNNDKFCKKAADLGISLKTWDPVHTQKHFKDYPNKFMNSENIGNRIVLLPNHNKMKSDDAQYIAEMVRKLIKNSGIVNKV